MGDRHSPTAASSPDPLRRRATRAVSHRGAWRLAGLLFTGGAASAIAPALLLTDGGGVWKFVLIGLGFLTGLLCFVIRWQRHSELWLHAIPIVAVAEITAGTLVIDFFFSYLYFFTAVYVALVFPQLRVLAPYLVLLAAAPFIGILSIDGDRSDAFRWALSVSPSLVLTAVVVGRLTAGLETSRQNYEQLSGEDGLTGVGNYRSLMNRLQEEISRHRRRRREFALLALDLDDFKAINETQGHLVGDLMLAIVGSLLDLEVRTEDMVFRQGGDEFTVIAPETGEAQAEELGERLEDALTDISAGGVMMSATVAHAIFPRDGASASELLDAADARLYQRRRETRRPRRRFAP